jgi:cold shock CspA family protein
MLGATSRKTVWGVQPKRENGAAPLAYLQRLLATRRQFRRLETKEQTMKSFGTVNSIDLEHGRGSIKPETGGENLPFERSAFAFDIKVNPPKTGQRLSYEVGTKDSKPVALNLQTI